MMQTDQFFCLPVFHRCFFTYCKIQLEDFMQDPPSPLFFKVGYPHKLGRGGKQIMRQTILQFIFFYRWQTGLFACSSEYYFKLDHACLCLSLWLCANTRELISFTGSGRNGFIPQDLITVRCPMCVGFKRPPAWLSVCQLGL